MRCFVMIVLTYENGLPLRLHCMVWSMTFMIALVEGHLELAHSI